MNSQCYKNIRCAIGILLLTFPMFSWSKSSCSDEFLTLFSAAEYRTIIETFSVEESRINIAKPSVRIGLAAMYKWGIGTESDMGLAASLVSGVPEDEMKQVFIHWNSCAETGNIAIQILLGIAYYDGLGVNQNLNMAKHYFANIESPIPQLGLAATYDRLGKRKESKRLVDILISSSAEINAFTIAELYYYGIIFDKDYLIAAEWYEDSAHQGGYHALGILGYMYTMGLGVNKDQVKGRYWFDLHLNHPNFKVDNSPVVSDIYSN